jgi:hypothetical protein
VREDTCRRACRPTRRSVSPTKTHIYLISERFEMTKTTAAFASEILDLEEIKQVIRETMAEELEILRKKIIACVEAAAADAFARLKDSYERGSEQMDPRSDASAPPEPLQKSKPDPAVAPDLAQNSVASGEPAEVSDLLQDHSKRLKPDLPHCLRGAKPFIFQPQYTSLPMYLEKLKGFFARHQIKTDLEKLQVAEYGLANKSIKPAEFETFSDFEAAFLAQDTSSQTIGKSKIFSEFYKSSRKHETLAEFSGRKLHQVEISFPDMPFAQFRDKFATQLPVKVAAAVIKAAPTTARQLNQLLIELDFHPRPNYRNNDNLQNQAFGSGKKTVRCMQYRERHRGLTGGPARRSRGMYAGPYGRTAAQSPPQKSRRPKSS